ncbi:hypothetical protein FGG08_007165 [Glutinoglossum americanum]|uniref:Uncharacterized protein n=1 Tax=Glutinoglossum americanum TaxID=1670608 RepID=A0A9P8L181_9PEZI|nr:hypothetical protein FGG08_007165 [Glutinoglossum americanum]
MDPHKQPQPSLPFDDVIPPNFMRPREPGALQDISSLHLDTKDALRSGRSYTMSSAVSETTSCMTFYSALGTVSWNGKQDEAAPSFEEQRKMGGHEDLQLGRSDSGYGSIDRPTDLQDDLLSEASGPNDSTVGLAAKSSCLSGKSHSVRSDENARKTRRRSGASDRSRLREHTRTEPDPSKTKSPRRSGSSTHRRSSNVDSRNRPGSERPVSKHSSKSLKVASSATRARPQPAIPTRSSSSAFPTFQRRKTDGSVTLQQSCHMFQSLGATLARYDTAHTEPKPVPRSNSASAIRHSASAPIGRGTLPAHDLPYLMATHIDQNSPHAGDVFLPRTVIDWKSPTTRRREYAEIDKRGRGIRGWWRRWSPSWCSKSSRLGFYNGEDNSDAGSVRRYRLELPDEDMSVDVQENEKDSSIATGKARFPWRRMSRAWSCFNLGEGPSGRWLSTVALANGHNSPYPQAAWGCLDEKQGD